MLLQRHPDLERPKAPRQFDSVVAEPDRSARGAPFVGGQVAGSRGEGSQVVGLPTHQETSRVIGHVEPFVEIEGDRIRPIHRLEQGLQPRGEDRDGADGPVDVEPEFLGLAKIGQALEVVDGSGVDRARAADDGEGLQALRAVEGYGVSQRGNLDLEAFVDGNQTQIVASQAQKLGGLLDAAVGLDRGVVDQLSGRGADPLGSEVEAGHGVPRHREPQDIGHRSSAGKQTAGFGRQSEQGLEPLDHLPLDVVGGVIAAADVRVHGRGEHFRQRPQRRAGPDDPAPEARMDVTQGIG